MPMMSTSSHDPVEKRKREELDLVATLLKTVLEATRTMYMEQVSSTPQPSLARGIPLQQAGAGGDNINISDRSAEQVKQQATSIRPSSRSNEILTDMERRIFHRFTYYDWTMGALAGGTTFGLLFGGMRVWGRQASAATKTRAAQRTSKPSMASSTAGTTSPNNLPPPPTTSLQSGSQASFSLPKTKRVTAIPIRKSNEYWKLDAPAPSTQSSSGVAASPATRQTRPPSPDVVSSRPTSVLSFNSSSSSSSSLSNSLALSDDVNFQVQFMISAGVSIVVLMLTSRFCTDRVAFCRDLAGVPTQVPTSLLTQAMCPALLDKVTTVPEHQQEWLQPTAVTETSELDAIMQLVQNCKQKYQGTLQ